MRVAGSSAAGSYENRRREGPRLNMRNLAIFFAAAAVAALAGCSAPQKGPLGSESNPIQMAVVPSLETGHITASADTLAREIEKHTGYTIKVSVPVSYAAVIEAMGGGRVDVAWLAPLSYVLAHQNVGAEPLLIAERDEQTNYFGIVLVLKDSGITKIEQLKGKRFAFVDPLSTSGTVYPKSLLKERGIDPDHDLQTIFAGGHDKAIIALYNKQVDACSCYGGWKTDARDRVEGTIPDVKDKTVIIGKTALIPNDNVSVRKDLPAEMKEKLKRALLDISASEEGRKMLLDVADINGLQPTTDAVYDSVRTAVQGSGVDLKQAVKSEGPKRKAPAKKP